MKPLPEHDDLVRQYLLGRLPEPLRQEFGERLFAEESFFETVQAVEMELRDAYARGELSGKDRGDFETNLLRTERQRKASMVSSVLAQSLPKSPQKQSRRWAHWALVAAAAIAIPAAFYAAYLQQQLRVLSRPEVAARMQPATGQMPAVVSLFLPGIVLRGAESVPQLRIASNEALIRLEVEVAQPGPFVVTLSDAVHAELFRQSGARPANGALVIWLPAASLPDGLIELRVTAEGAEERRTLRVSR